MRRLSDSIMQNMNDAKKISKVNNAKKRLKAILGNNLYSSLLRGYSKAANRSLVKKIYNNKELENTEDGRCFLIGNGPSIKTQDLSFLKNEKVFTCNYFYDCELIGGAIPVAHFITDPRLFDGTNPPIIEVLFKCKDNGTEKLFVCVDACEQIEKYDIANFFEVFYLFQSAPMVKGKNYPINNIIPSFNTVIHSEILTAAYLGFKEIFLLGCDCSGFINLANIYLGEDASKGYCLNLSDAMEDAVKETLTRNSLTEELRLYADIFDSYHSLNEYCHSHGIKLLNATETTLLTEIPRISVNDIDKTM